MATLLTFAATNGSAAGDAAVGSLRVVHPRAAPSPPGARTGAAYVTIENSGTTGDRLVAASSDAAGSVEVHQMRMDNGVMRMRAVPALPIPAGQSVTLGPGGYHLMLLDLKRPLKSGDRVTLVLRFEKAGGIELSMPVEKSPPGF